MDFNSSMDPKIKEKKERKEKGLIILVLTKTPPKKYI
jgi:hypothetical protein